MGLPELEARYFAPHSAFPFRGTTEVTPYIDGIAYFQAIAESINATTGAQDAVYIVNWAFDHAMDPLVPPPAAPVNDIGTLLRRKAAAGVDVRLVLFGNHTGIPATAVDTNLDSIEALRASAGGLPGIESRMLFDYTGPAEGSHHQKSVLVLHQGQLTAYVGGMDFIRWRLDAAPHSRFTYPVRPGGPWGWHDTGVRLVGLATRAVWVNFASRWFEASTLPRSDTFTRWAAGTLPRRVRTNPLHPVPSVAANPPPVAPRVDPARSVQVLRSRYEYKTGQLPWSGTPDGGIYEVWDTLSHAISAATRYIYIEDQFLANSTGAFLISGHSLFPLLSAAMDRGVKVILLGSGYTDPSDTPAGPTNRSLNSDLTDMVGRVRAANRSNLAVWRLEHATVHSKLTLIDDVFMAAGSANMHSRSMTGVDAELHVAIVDDGSLVTDFRVELWRQHMGLDPDSAALPVLRDLATGLAAWKNQMWLPPGADGQLWQIPGHPNGFAPSHPSPRAYVGPYP